MSLWKKGIQGLFSSRKGTLCLILFFGAVIPMTILCALGKLDGTAYGVCLSALTGAVVAIFCHTQSKTDQILGAPTIMSTIQNVIGGNHES